MSKIVGLLWPAPVKRIRTSPAHPTVFRQTSFRTPGAHDPRGNDRAAVPHSIRQLLLAGAVKRARRHALQPVNGPASPWPARRPVIDDPEHGPRLVLPLRPGIIPKFLPCGVRACFP